MQDQQMQDQDHRIYQLEDKLVRIDRYCEKLEKELKMLREAIASQNTAMDKRLEEFVKTQSFRLEEKAKEESSTFQEKVLLMVTEANERWQTSTAAVLDSVSGLMDDVYHIKPKDVESLL